MSDDSDYQRMARLIMNSGKKPQTEPLTSNPKDWRCFYCDEVFTTEVDARNHFGSLEGSETACRIKAPGEFALLQALRNAEEALARYRAEDSDALRAMWSMTADHQTALRREEEKGYARALRDTNYKEPALETECVGPYCPDTLKHCDRMCMDFCNIRAERHSLKASDGLQVGAPECAIKGCGQPRSVNHDSLLCETHRDLHQAVSEGA